MMIKFRKQWQQLLTAFTLLLCLSGQSAQADSQGQTLLIPIAVGDITTFVPILPTPAGVGLIQVADSYELSWDAVGSAAYYQIIVTDSSGKQQTFIAQDSYYALTAIGVGNFKVEVQACNSANQCGTRYQAGSVSIAQSIRYQHTDMLGSVVAESDSAGNITSRSHYEPFGKRLGGDKAGIGYTGHLQDVDLNLTYMQARYYDPLIGRFYSNDPVGFRDVHSFNRYAYGNNNPYRYTDPTGMCSEENSGSKIACAAEDYLKEKLEPVIEDAMKEAGVDVKSAGERDPDGEYEHQAGDNTTIEEISAILIVGAKAKIGKRKGPRPKTKGANSKDKKQVNDAAKTAGIKDRAGFGKFIENEKKMSGRGGSDNYSYEELNELADEFKRNGGS